MTETPALRVRSTKQGGLHLLLTHGPQIAETTVASKHVEAGGHVALIALLTAVFQLEDTLGVTL